MLCTNYKKYIPNTCNNNNNILVENLNNNVSFSGKSTLKSSLILKEKIVGNGKC